jgi:hypothetical protein
VPTLADTQLLFRNALVYRDAASITSTLAGGPGLKQRLAIHQRNYETSLINALLGKFPAAVWLVGSTFVTEAARTFVHKHPPHAPCIADYGEMFPRFLSSCPGAERLLYLREFAELEWILGHISVAINQGALSLQELATFGSEALIDAIVELQPGVRYLQASWPIDELIHLYLSGTAPDSFVFNSANVWLQIRGARGEFQIDRLGEAEFVFRNSIAAGQPIGVAVERALDRDSNFDYGQALVTLVTDKLVTHMASGAAGEK